MDKFFTRDRLRGLLATLVIPLGAISYCDSFMYLCSKADNKNSSDVEVYAHKNMSAIMQKQEKLMGITYDGVPRLLFADKLEGRYSENVIILGNYDVSENEIRLSNFDIITPDITLVNIIKRLGIAPSGVEEILAHELGHFYVDTLNERNKGKSWPQYNSEIFENLGTKMVSEGIAEYFSRILTGFPDDFSDEEWPSEILFFGENKYKLSIDEKIAYFLNVLSAQEGETFLKSYADERVIYDGGYHLVKPIIDLYGQEGIEYLLEKYPVYEDLLDIKSYQRDVLKDLE